MTLYQLQASWDDERAHRRVADLRAALRPAVRADLAGLPWALTLAGAALFLFAMVTP